MRWIRPLLVTLACLALTISGRATDPPGTPALPPGPKAAEPAREPEGADDRPPRKPGAKAGAPPAVTVVELKNFRRWTEHVHERLIIHWTAWEEHYSRRPGSPTAEANLGGFAAIGAYHRLRDARGALKQLDPNTPYEAHHGVMSAWMRAHHDDYNARRAPTVLMSQDAHNETRRVYNSWRNVLAPQSPDGFNWSRVSDRDMRALARRMFDAAGVPRPIQAEYFRQFRQYRRDLSFFFATDSRSGLLCLFLLDGGLYLL